MNSREKTEKIKNAIEQKMNNDIASITIEQYEKIQKEAEKEIEKTKMIISNNYMCI